MFLPKSILNSIYSKPGFIHHGSRKGRADMHLLRTQCLQRAELHPHSPFWMGFHPESHRTCPLSLPIRSAHGLCVSLPDGKLLESKNQVCILIIQSPYVNLDTPSMRMAQVSRRLLYLFLRQPDARPLTAGSRGLSVLRDRRPSAVGRPCPPPRWAPVLFVPGPALPFYFPFSSMRYRKYISHKTKAGWVV